jgi:membrane-associated phospholipid phosphatase
MRTTRTAVPHRVLALGLAAAAAIATAAVSTPAQAKPPTARTSGRPNIVVEWNATLLSLVSTPGAQPAAIHPTRDFAIMSAAVYDAVAATEPGRPQYLLHLQAPRTASRDAAAAQAAHDTLAAMFPAFAGALDTHLDADLAAIPPGGSRSAGIRVGAESASELLQTRANDGSSTPPPPYQSTGAAGDYRPTPPAFAAPVFVHWGAVTPFVLRHGDQFRATQPPALTSPAYGLAIDEVQSLGRLDSSSRTPEQTTIANFWAAPIQNYWNAIAEQVSVANRDDTAASARTFALLDLGLADATIALYDSKYTYRLWRPITAIRLADTDRNVLTIGDPTWTPLATTPADPSYPGAHSALSAAAATVLGSRYGSHVSFSVSSPTLPGISRSFHGFAAAATEAGLSRIYAGVHTRIDHEAGLRLGYHVGSYTLRHALSHDHE